MNKNEFAKQITLVEGKKVQLSIAQVKEVLKLFCDAMKDWDDKQIIKFIREQKTREAK